MSGYIEGKTNTKQYSLIPTCYDEMISEDNPVRVLEAFVDSLDLKELNFKNANRDKTVAGMPSYNPKDLLKLYLFGTIKRNLGYTYLLLRGNEKVKGESFMHFLIYNIKRVCNIKKTKDIIEAIKAKRKEETTQNIVAKIFFSNFSEERVAEDVDPYNYLIIF